jgi:hypothetical protein
MSSGVWTGEAALESGVAAGSSWYASRARAPKRRYLPEGEEALESVTMVNSFDIMG